MTEALARTAILFDLDGTLTDPFEGITRSIQYALGRMGRPVPQADDLRWCIGPPLKSGFQTLLASQDDAQADEAVRLYRERYSATGKFENVLIEGIPDVLAALRMRGYALFVATSKLKTYAGEIIDHFELRQYFDAVYGSEADGANSAKSDLIRYILDSEALDPENCVMIGDRSHDVIGATANHVPTIGVRWGYAAQGELEAAGAFSVATSPAELPAQIELALNRT